MAESQEELKSLSMKMKAAAAAKSLADLNLNDAWHLLHLKSLSQSQ